MPKVTILITTFNLEKYIEKALDSVLNQKTNFQFKVYIADDASTDETVTILKRYKDQYSDKIELFLHNKNKGSLLNSIFLYEKCKTEYFVFLDGDDFWIDELKLEKQVKFLEQNLQYAICGGNTKILKDNKFCNKILKKRFLGKSYSINDYYKNKVPFIHTSSILFRNNIFKENVPRNFYDVLDTFEECALRGEDFRFLLHLKSGKAYVFKECFSVYRIHPGGIWQGAGDVKRKLESLIYYNYNKKYWADDILMNEFFAKKFFTCYKNFINDLMEKSQKNLYKCMNCSEFDLFIKLQQDIYKYNSKNN